MDINMQVMDGLSATKEIIRNHTAAKIVIVTNYPESDFKEEALRSGASGYVMKENMSDLPALLSKTAINSARLS
jgi:DNA-binding NarL/FixJ family response regulator